MGLFAQSHLYQHNNRHEDFDMSMFELQDVTLGDLEGQGYAFKKRTAFGKARRGIFFVQDEEDLEKLQAEDTLLFEGPCYYRSRGPRDRSFEVQIIQTIPTRFGHRIDFEAVDNPEPVLMADAES